MTTRFKHWRASLGLTQAGAGGALGISTSWIKQLDAGTRRDGKGEAKPDRRTRLAMAAIKAKLPPYGG